jgi:hypothetical protein
MPYLMLCSRKKTDAAQKVCGVEVNLERARLTLAKIKRHAFSKEKSFAAELRTCIIIKETEHSGWDQHSRETLRGDWRSRLI